MTLIEKLKQNVEDLAAHHAKDDLQRGLLFTFAELRQLLALLEAAQAMTAKIKDSPAERPSRCIEDETICVCCEEDHACADYCEWIQFTQALAAIVEGKQ